MLSDKTSPIELKEFIDQIKQELLKEHDTDDPLFVISEVSLEIQIVAERNAKGGVDFKVLQAGVDKTITNVHTVSVTLEPIVTPAELRAGLDEQKKQKAAQKLVRTYIPRPTTRG